MVTLSVLRALLHLLGLLQPEPHVHLTVHRRGGLKVSIPFDSPSSAEVQLRQASVAVGHQRAHTKLLRESVRLTVQFARQRGFETVRT